MIAKLVDCVLDNYDAKKIESVLTYEGDDTNKNLRYLYQEWITGLDVRKITLFLLKTTTVKK